MSSTASTHHPYGGDGVNAITTTKSIFSTGHSLVVTVTKEAGLMDLKKGDVVRITIEKVGE